MSNADQAERLRHLEDENLRLRRMLDAQGVSSTLRHQVRNTLGLMRAILRRSVEGKTTVEDFAAHVEGRFDALLRVQTALLSSPDGRADPATLVADEFLAQTIVEGERATIDGPPLRLDSRQAELLGLVLHELATNALKFGARTSPTGHIEVSWRTTSSPPRLTLTWTESGMRQAGSNPTLRGFGMEAIEGMLPYQLKADTTLEFLTEGMRCTVSLPISPAAASEAALSVPAPS